MADAGVEGNKASQEAKRSGKVRHHFMGSWLDLLVPADTRYYIAVHDMFYREKPELHEEHLLTRWPSKASFGLLTGPREKTAYPRQEEDVKSNYPRP